MNIHPIAQTLEEILRRFSGQIDENAQRYFLSIPFIDAYGQLIEENCYDVLCLAQLFHPVYEEIYHKSQKEWLLEILTYTMHLNFQGFESEVVEERIPYHHLFLEALRHLSELERTHLGDDDHISIALLTPEEEMDEVILNTLPLKGNSWIITSTK